MKHFSLVILMLGMAFTLSAQNRAPSPSATIEQRVGLTDITVEYSRPGIKGRTLFTDNSPLAPLGKMWRTGANSATKVTFSADVKVGGKEVAAGSYALLTIPSASSWTINLYPYKESRWSTYRDATPAVSVMAAPVTMDSSIESFMIEFDELKDYSAAMILGWGNTIVPIPIEVN